MPVAKTKRPGDVTLPAREWNDLLRRLAVLERRASFTLGGLSIPAAACAVPFSYQATDGDVILARLVIDGVTATANTPIAKPYLHRPSITARGAQTFVYSADFTRVATEGAVNENQVLVPNYEIGDIVFAVRCPYFTGVLYPTTQPVQWLQFDHGRAWALASA